MCYREVQCTRHCCGHDAPKSEQRMDCGSSNCRYSSKHNPGCQTCPTSCKQWLRPAQTVVTSTSNSPCTHCSR
ncbi:hypothetical protein BDQ17DRAFT_1237091 [Cyathus striatus]|nr:hypothetical protein BDQ17DRAFT_1237091 [Cyathus striatus]